VGINNRWFQLCASLVAMIMIANLQYAWTFFVEPMQSQTGWQRSEIQAAFALFVLFQTWVQPFDGWLVDRVGPRWFITVAGVLCGLGWAGIGQATSLPMLYTMYCVAGVGAAFVYSCSIGSALKWFEQRRGLASGIMAAGFGGGTALFIPVISWLISWRGYQATFLVTGLLQGVVIVVVAQFLRHPPHRAQTRAVARETRIGRRQFGTLEMLRTRQFQWMYFAFVLMATGGLLVTANAGSMARSWGISAGALTLAATLSPLANAGARTFWGWFSDRVGRETTMVLTFALQAVCLCAMAMLGPLSPTLFAATLVAVYFTWGQIYSLFPALSADYFGTRNATSNYALLYTAKGVASIIGAWAGALIFDQTSSWTVGFYGSAAMALVAVAAALRLRAASRATAELADSSGPGVATPALSR
jgi:OFA family oxalate/formate antiporter-like MFS transporter